MDIPTTLEEVGQRMTAGTLTENEAIEFVVVRFGEMFEAINGVKPSRGNEPAHHTLIRWCPTITDYQHITAQARADVLRANERADRAERVSGEAWGITHRVQHVTGTFVRAREALRNALQLIDAPRPEDPIEPALRELQETWDYTPEELADIREKMQKIYAIGAGR